MQKIENVSDEVLQHSFKRFNASILSIISEVVIPTIEKDELAKTFLKTKKDTAIVLAHGFSTEDSFNIFLEKEDNNWIKITDFLDDYVKQTNVILFCCNRAGCKIEYNRKNIVYPTSVTKYLGTSFVGNEKY